MCARRDGARYLRQVQVHRRGIAEGSGEPGRLTALRPYRFKDVGRGRSLVMRSAGSSIALPPATGDLVLLSDPSFGLVPAVLLLTCGHWRVRIEMMTSGFGDEASPGVAASIYDSFVGLPGRIAQGFGWGARKCKSLGKIDLMETKWSGDVDTKILLLNLTSCQYRRLLASNYSPVLKPGRVDGVMASLLGELQR